MQSLPMLQEKHILLPSKVCHTSCRPRKSPPAVQGSPHLPSEAVTTLRPRQSPFGQQAAHSLDPGAVCALPEGTDDLWTSDLCAQSVQGASRRLVSEVRRLAALPARGDEHGGECEGVGHPQVAHQNDLGVETG